MDSLAKITILVARSHMYWGRKPITDLVNIFEAIKEGDIVLDPFCGSGNPAIAALIKGGRVIAGDLNPMAVFLTKVLIRPINLATLKSTFEDVAASVSHNILEKYEIRCPNCKQTAIIKYLVWSNKNHSTSIPENAQIECSRCHRSFFTKLSSAEAKRQQELSQLTPTFWFPLNTINSTRKPPVEHHYELFTGRNLSMLAELLHAIKKVPSENIRDALLYVFTAVLYSCSSMQMFSEKERSSSRGWTALRFYIPPMRKEVNVWQAFERRFNNFRTCKRELLQNNFLSSVRITDSIDEFSLNNYEALSCKADAFDLISQAGNKAKFVFLDPPYIDDIDYFAFSEFWGVWLEMHFNFDKEWHPRRTKAELLKKLLMLLSEVTSKSCEICLAFAPKQQKGWNEEECIKESKYHIKRTGFFNYDNSNKRGAINNQSNRYTILESKKSKVSSQVNTPIFVAEDDKLQQLFPYLCVIGHLYPKEQKSQASPHREKTFFERTRTSAAQLVPNRLSKYLMNLKDEEIGKAISDKKVNENTYHSLCYFFLRIILSKDTWKISYVDPAQFEGDVFGVMHQEVYCMRPAEVPEGIAFVAQNDTKKILFCFDDQAPTLIEEVANIIKDSDKGEFNKICVMIVRDKGDMKSRRRFTKADKWPRGFFLCFEEIRRKAETLNEREYSQFCAPAPSQQPSKRSPIRSLTAEVKENIPVGENRSHYKLRFRTAHSFNIIPGQFIMMDTALQEQDTIRELIPWDTMNPSQIAPKPYLKRPFGIHRAFYRHFSEDKAYIQKLSLPPELATVLHTVFPNEFEIFYKVLTNGIGTKELSKLQEGAKIKIVGPLGKGQIIREIRDKGFDEIHVIGGGVGMAPLIFIVQALRYYSYNVKAFIGTEKISMLKYKQQAFDGLDATFTDEDPTIYIDDLLETGINSDDIYVSSTEPESICKKIPEKNSYKGFVSDQYNKYLQDTCTRREKILAFACGPMGMMKALVPITEKCGIPLKVLMEKRMACGIGVCLSCVCETKKPEEAKSKYSRVCTDGPIFDASEIIWK